MVLYWYTISLTTLTLAHPEFRDVGVVGFAAAAAWYSHYAQKRDKAIMRAGVERDKERLKLLRQRQNAAQLHGGGEGAASTS